MSLTFNVTVNSFVSGYASYAGLIVSNLQYAGASFSSLMNATASIEVVVNIQDVASDTANGGAVTSTFLYSAGGMEYWQFGTISEILTGSDPNGAAYDVQINIDPDYIDDWLYFDPNPSPASFVPNDRVDAIELFQHELGHALGFNGFLDWSTARPVDNDLSTFDTWIQIIGGDPYFVGPEAVDVYGGPVPLTQGNLYHIGNASGLPGDELSTHVMNGVVGLLGKSPGFTQLEIAMFEDVGLPIAQAEPAPAYIQELGRLYEAGLGRAFDTPGLNFWIDQREAGMSLWSISWNFLESREFTQNFGDDDAMSNSRFLEVLYQNVLDRSPDQGGLSWWLSRLNGGYSHEDTLISFANSAENVAQSTYLAALHETAVGYWSL